MKKLLLILFIPAILFAAIPFTLDNLTNLRVFCMNKTDFIDKSQVSKIKTMAEEKLKSAGIVMNKIDASTVMIKLESLKLEKLYVVNVTLAVGEEIITKRKDSPQTLAFTYFMNDMIDTDEPYDDTIESINFLLDGFVEAYINDKE